MDHAAEQQKYGSFLNHLEMCMLIRMYLSMCIGVSCVSA